MLNNKTGPPETKKQYEKPQVVAHAMKLGIYGQYGQGDNPRTYLGSDDPGGPKTPR